jgi:hypothetical protein
VAARRGRRVVVQLLLQPGHLVRGLSETLDLLHDRGSGEYDNGTPADPPRPP